MKKIVVPIRLPSADAKDVDIPLGGEVKGIVMSVEKVVGSIFAVDGKQQVREVVNLIVECPVEDETVEPTLVKRNFLVCGSGQLIEGQLLAYIGSTASPHTGNLLHVFESIESPKV